MNFCYCTLHVCVELANQYPAPTQLQMTHYSNTCLLLEWSCKLAAHSETSPTILGHRVYVNGIAEGQVTQ